jgi:hypothetical protein
LAIVARCPHGRTPEILLAALAMAEPEEESPSHCRRSGARASPARPPSVLRAAPPADPWRREYRKEKDRVAFDFDREDYLILTVRII